MANPLLSTSLRLLSAASPLAARLGLEDQLEQVVATGTRRGAAWLMELQARAKRERPDEDRGPKRRFDLTPTESQALIQQTMRRFADEVVRPAAAEADDAMAPPEEVLAHAAELGLIELAIDEAHGGAAEERSPVTGALALEELARGDLALALALMGPVSAANLIQDLGDDDQKKAWLPRLLDGGFVPAAPALLEPGPRFDPRKLSTRATAKLGGARLRGYRVVGRKALVPLGRSARFFLVSATLDGAPRVFVVEADRPGVEVEPAPAMGLRGADLCALRLDVEVPRDALLASDDAGRARDLGRIGWGALAVGQSQAMLEYVMRYCDDRVAFGEPITHRQSVAFLIADVAIELEGLRLMTWRAAAAAERGEPIARLAHLVKVQANRVAMQIGTDGVQLLGGAGFIREHPVERWYRHLRGVATMEGAVAP